MITTENIIAVSVWFHPTKDNLKALSSYSGAVSQVIVIDNSEGSNEYLFEDGNISNLLYFPQFNNIGVATALNVACRKAIELGAEWILTMDQDSSFSENGMDIFIREANFYAHFDRVAIFCPIHRIVGAPKAKIKGDRFFDLDQCMTSGNLLNSSAFEKVGGFADAFFIDMVDIEFCYRLRKRGYLIVRTNQCELAHHLGDKLSVLSFFGKKKYFDVHSPLRKYYLARNILYMGRLHPEIRKKCISMVINQMKKVILYDKYEKRKKIKAMLKGIRDHRREKYGKCELK